MSVTLVDTTHVLIAFYDDARSVGTAKGRLAFADSVAAFTVRHYASSRLATVAVTFGRTTVDGMAVVERPVVFVTEYHPDGQVRLAPLLPPPLDRRPD